MSPKRKPTAHVNLVRGKLVRQEVGEADVVDAGVRLEEGLHQRRRLVHGHASPQQRGARRRKPVPVALHGRHAEGARSGWRCAPPAALKVAESPPAGSLATLITEPYWCSLSCSSVESTPKDDCATSVRAFSPSEGLAPPARGARPRCRGRSQRVRHGVAQPPVRLEPRRDRRGRVAAGLLERVAPPPAAPPATRLRAVGRGAAAAVASAASGCAAPRRRRPWRRLAAVAGLASAELRRDRGRHAGAQRLAGTGSSGGAARRRDRAAGANPCGAGAERARAALHLRTKGTDGTEPHSRRRGTTARALALRWQVRLPPPARRPAGQPARGCHRLPVQRARSPPPVKLTLCAFASRLAAPCGINVEDPVPAGWAVAASFDGGGGWAGARCCRVPAGSAGPGGSRPERCRTGAPKRV
jgi:hypothetical protein